VRATAATNKKLGDQLSGSQKSESKSSKVPENASQIKPAAPKAASKATAAVNKGVGTLDENDREPIKVWRQRQAHYGI